MQLTCFPTELFVAILFTIPRKLPDVVFGTFTMRWIYFGENIFDNIQINMYFVFSLFILSVVTVFSYILYLLFISALDALSFIAK